MPADNFFYLIFEVLSMKKYLVCIIGPTAIGKTSRSIDLAKHFQTEIISADSRQFYKEMQIGTAVPSKSERQGIPHHFIQHLSVDEDYSVGDFERDVLHKLEELFQKHDLVLMVGGSGLFVDAITKGLNKFPEVSPKIREELNKRLQQESLESLQLQLKELDPEYFATAAMDNPRRVIRALEICLSSGKPYSDFVNQPKAKRNFNSIKIGLTADREIMYDRINRRVDRMMEEDLLKEAVKLYPNRDKNALNTIGYKELYAYLDGEITLDFAVDEIKKNTRRFAKRQMTWFRKDEEIEWFPYDRPSEEIIAYLQQKTV